MNNTTAPEAAVAVAPYLMSVLSFLKFDPGYIKHFPSNIESRTPDPVLWTAAWPTDVLISLLFAAPRLIQFTCHAKSEDKTPLTEVEFCFESVSSSNFSSSEKCVTVSGNQTKSVTVSNNTAEVQSEPGIGATAKLSLKSITYDEDMLYVKCKATNIKGTINSNRAILDDLRFVFPPETILRPLPIISLYDRTYLFCGTKKINTILSKMKAFPSPRETLSYEWHSCYKDECSKLDFGGKWKFQVVSIFGDLILYQPPSKEAVLSQMRKGRYFTCSLHEKRLSIYRVTHPIKFDERMIARPFNLIYPQFGNVVLLNKPGFVYKVPVFHVGNLVNVTYTQWKTSEMKFKFGQTYFEGALTVTEDGLTFRAPFSPDVAAVYSYLVVFKYDWSNAPLNYADGLVKVTVFNLPVISESVPQTTLSFLGNKFTFTCRFRNAETIKSIRFCGHDVDMRTSAYFLQSVKKKCGSHISPNVTPALSDYPPDAFKPLVISHTVPMEAPLSSYHLTCVGSSSNFQTQKDVIVKIVEPPKIETSYSLYAREKCHLRCTYKCSLKNNRYYLEHGFYVHYYWGDTKESITDLSKDTVFEEEEFKQSARNDYTLSGFGVSSPRVLVCRIRLVSRHSGDVVYESPALAVEVAPGCNLTCVVALFTFAIFFLIVGLTYFFYLRRFHIFFKY